MEKQKNSETQNQTQPLMVIAVVFIVLAALGVLGTVIELVVGIIGLVVGLVAGVIGLVVGLIGGVIGLVGGLLGGIVGIIGAVIGLVAGLLPIIIPVLIVYAIVKAINGENPLPKQKRKNVEIS